jgi:hypothetical protein
LAEEYKKKKSQGDFFFLLALIKESIGVLGCIPKEVLECL